MTPEIQALPQSERPIAAAAPCVELHGLKRLYRLGNETVHALAGINLTIR